MMRAILASKTKLVRHSVGTALRNAGFEVEESQTAGDTTGAMAKDTRCVLILDEDLSDLKADVFLKNLQEMEVDPWPPIALLASDHDLEAKYRALGVQLFLYPPRMPAMVVVKIKGLLGSGNISFEDQEAVRCELRKYNRIKVKDLNLSVYTPVRELSHVVDFSFCGLKAKTEKINAEHVGTSFKMQLIYHGETVMVEGKVMWARDGYAGICFALPKPGNFQGFFKGVSAHAILGNFEARS